MTIIFLIGCLGGLCYVCELLYRLVRAVFKPRKLKAFDDSDAQQGQKGGEEQ